MRTVYPNREIPHLWAHKTQSRARNAKGTLYFDGATIYSYGNYFPIARHVTNAKGASAVFVNPDRYSVTTSKHQSMVRASIPPSIPVFNLDPDTTPTRALSEYGKRLNDAIGKMSRARDNAEWRHRTAIEIRKEALAFCAFYDLDVSTLPDVPALDSEALAAYKAKEAERNKVKREAYKAKEAERKAMIERACEAWRNGSADYSMHFYSAPPMLRLTADKAEVETSRGVKVPVDAAKLALELVREVKATGVAWSSPPAERVSIGHFSLDKVDADGTLHAGCHVIPFVEIERFTASVGW